MENLVPYQPCPSPPVSPIVDLHQSKATSNNTFGSSPSPGLPNPGGFAGGGSTASGGREYARDYSEPNSAGGYVSSDWVGRKEYMNQGDDVNTHRHYQAQNVSQRNYGVMYETQQHSGDFVGEEDDHYDDKLHGYHDNRNHAQTSLESVYENHAIDRRHDNLAVSKFDSGHSDSDILSRSTHMDASYRYDQPIVDDSHQTEAASYNDHRGSVGHDALGLQSARNAYDADGQSSNLAINAESHSSSSFEHSRNWDSERYGGVHFASDSHAIEAAAAEPSLPHTDGTAHLNIDDGFRPEKRSYAIKSNSIIEQVDIWRDNCELGFWAFQYTIDELDDWIAEGLSFSHGYYSIRKPTLAFRSFYGDQWVPEMMRRLQDTLAFSLRHVKWVQKILAGSSVDLLRPFLSADLHYDDPVSREFQPVIMDALDGMVLQSAQTGLDRYTFDIRGYSGWMKGRNLNRSDFVEIVHAEYDPEPPAPDPNDPAVQFLKRQEARCVLHDSIVEAVRSIPPSEPPPLIGSLSLLKIRNGFEVLWNYLVKLEHSISDATAFATAVMQAPNKLFVLLEVSESGSSVSSSGDMSVSNALAAEIDIYGYCLTARIAGKTFQAIGASEIGALVNVLAQIYGLQDVAQLVMKHKLDSDGSLLYEPWYSSLVDAKLFACRDLVCQNLIWCANVGQTDLCLALMNLHERCHEISVEIRPINAGGSFQNAAFCQIHFFATRVSGFGPSIGFACLSALDNASKAFADDEFNGMVCTWAQILFIVDPVPPDSLSSVLVTPKSCDLLNINLPVSLPPLLSPDQIVMFQALRRLVFDAFLVDDFSREKATVSLDVSKGLSSYSKSSQGKPDRLAGAPADLTNPGTCAKLPNPENAHRIRVVLKIRGIGNQLPTFYGVGSSSTSVLLAFFRALLDCNADLGWLIAVATAVANRNHSRGDEEELSDAWVWENCVLGTPTTAGGPGLAPSGGASGYSSCCHLARRWLADMTTRRPELFFDKDQMPYDDLSVWWSERYGDLEGKQFFYALLALLPGDVRQMREEDCQPPALAPLGKKGRNRSSAADGRPPDGPHPGAPASSSLIEGYLANLRQSYAGEPLVFDSDCEDEEHVEEGREDMGLEGEEGLSKGEETPVDGDVERETETERRPEMGQPADADAAVVEGPILQWTAVIDDDVRQTGGTCQPDDTEETFENSDSQPEATQPIGGGVGDNAVADWLAITTGDAGEALDREAGGRQSEGRPEPDTAASRDNDVSRNLDDTAGESIVRAIPGSDTDASAVGQIAPDSHEIAHDECIEDSGFHVTSGESSTSQIVDISDAEDELESDFPLKTSTDIPEQNELVDVGLNPEQNVKSIELRDASLGSNEPGNSAAVDSLSVSLAAKPGELNQSAPPGSNDDVMSMTPEADPGDPLAANSTAPESSHSEPDEHRPEVEAQSRPASRGQNEPVTESSWNKPSDGCAVLPAAGASESGKSKAADRLAQWRKRLEASDDTSDPGGSGMQIIQQGPKGDDQGTDPPEALGTGCTVPADAEEFNRFQQVSSQFLLREVSKLDKDGFRIANCDIISPESVGYKNQVMIELELWSPGNNRFDVRKSSPDFVSSFLGCLNEFRKEPGVGPAINEFCANLTAQKLGLEPATKDSYSVVKFLQHLLKEGPSDQSGSALVSNWLKTFLDRMGDAIGKAKTLEMIANNDLAVLFAFLVFQSDNPRLAESDLDNFLLEVLSQATTEGQETDADISQRQPEVAAGSSECNTNVSFTGDQQLVPPQPKHVFPILGYNTAYQTASSSGSVTQQEDSSGSAIVFDHAANDAFPRLVDQNHVEPAISSYDAVAETASDLGSTPASKSHSDIPESIPAAGSGSLKQCDGSGHAASADGGDNGDQTSLMAQNLLRILAAGFQQDQADQTAPSVANGSVAARNIHNEQTDGGYQGDGSGANLEVPTRGGDSGGVNNVLTVSNDDLGDEAGHDTFENWDDE